MTLSNIWTNDNRLRSVFSWLTRIGAAPKFGTLPIAYYQQDQCKAIEALEKALKMHGLPDYSELKTQSGYFYAKAGPGSPWVKIAMLTCGQITPVERKQAWSGAECGE